MGRAAVIHDTEVGTYEISLSSGFSVTEKNNFQAIIATIKTIIPSSDRTYNPTSRTWTILDKYWPVINASLHALNFRVVVDIKKVSKTEEEFKANFFYNDTPTSANAETAETIATKLSAFLGVRITSQDINELKSLYRKKARSLHPDLGGDAAQMSELNRLWTLYTAGGVN